MYRFLCDLHDHLQIPGPALYQDNRFPDPPGNFPVLVAGCIGSHCCLGNSYRFMQTDSEITDVIYIRSGSDPPDSGPIL